MWSKLRQKFAKTKPDAEKADTTTAQTQPDGMVVGASVSRFQLPKIDRAFKVGLLALLGGLVVIFVGYKVYLHVTNKTIVIGDTKITTKQIKTDASQMGAWAKEKKETFGGPVNQVAQDDLILNAALKDQAKKLGIAVTQDDIDASLAGKYKTYGGKESYQADLKLWGIQDFVNVRDENQAYENKLGEKLILTKQLFYVGIFYDSPYFNESKDPAALRAQATKIMTDKFLPLFKQGLSKEAIADQADRQSNVRPMTQAQLDALPKSDDSQAFFTGMPTSAYYIPVYSAAEPQFNDAQGNSKIPGVVGTNDTANKLTKVGQYTDVITTKAGFIGIMRLEGKTSGMYNTWDDLLNQYKKDYAQQLSFNEVANKTFASYTHIVITPFAATFRTFNELFGFKKASAVICSDHIVHFKWKSFDNVTNAQFSGITVTEQRGTPGSCQTIGTASQTTNLNDWANIGGITDNCYGPGPDSWSKSPPPSGYSFSNADETHGYLISSGGYPSWQGATSTSAGLNANGDYHIRLWYNPPPPDQPPVGQFKAVQCPQSMVSGSDGVVVAAHDPDDGVTNGSDGKAIQVKVNWSGNTILGPSYANDAVSGYLNNNNHQFNGSDWTAFVQAHPNSTVNIYLWAQDKETGNWSQVDSRSFDTTACTPAPPNQNPVGQIYAPSCTIVVADAYDPDSGKHQNGVADGKAVNVKLVATVSGVSTQLVDNSGSANPSTPSANEAYSGDPWDISPYAVSSPYDGTGTNTWTDYVNAHMGQTINLSLSAQDIQTGSFVGVASTSYTPSCGCVTNCGGGPSNSLPHGTLTWSCNPDGSANAGTTNAGDSDGATQIQITLGSSGAAPVSPAPQNAPSYMWSVPASYTSNSSVRVYLFVKDVGSLGSGAFVTTDNQLVSCPSTPPSATATASFDCTTNTATIQVVGASPSSGLMSQIALTDTSGVNGSYTPNGNTDSTGLYKVPNSGSPYASANQSLPNWITGRTSTITLSVGGTVTVNGVPVIAPTHNVTCVVTPPAPVCGNVSTTPTTIQPGDNFTATVSINYNSPPPSGSTFTVNGQTGIGSTVSGNIITSQPVSLTAPGFDGTMAITYTNSATPTLPPCGGSVNVVVQPYFKAFGADVSSGGGFDSSCASTGFCGTSSASCDAGTGELTSWSGAGGGAGTQFAAFQYPKSPTTKIDGFSSGNTLGHSMTWLTFANTGLSGNPPYGGNFASNHCIQSYSPPSGAQPVPAALITGCTPDCSLNLEDLVAAGGGAFTYNGDLTVDGSFSGPLIPPGMHLSLFVNGKVNLDQGDVTYQNSDTWNNISQIPSFFMVAKDNIYIGEDFGQLDGVLVAQGNGSTIYTCTNGFVAARTVSECANQLNVHGVLIAGKIKLGRTFGSIKDATAGEYTHSGSPRVCTNGDSELVCGSEVFDFSPELYLSQPAIKPSSSSTGFDSITALPPVL